MFTGLVEAVGQVERVAGGVDGRDIRIATILGAELSVGDSVAVSGVCLTVTARDAHGFDAHISPETLTVTWLDEAKPGRAVNLERPIAAGKRFGGHFVLGHVDGMGRIVGLARDGESWRLEIEAPPALLAYLVNKGSIAIDGISLTIASLDAARVGVQIVPHTFAETSLSEARVGDTVNLEVDVIGKFVARQMEMSGAVLASGVAGPPRSKT